MTINESKEIARYVDKCWDRLYEYQKGVTNGTIITNKYMKNVVTWFKNTPEYEIKTKKIDRIFRFLYLVNIVNDNKYERIELMPWQAFYLGMIFGVYHKDTDMRRFSEAFTFIGRGNAKTTTGVAIALYFLLGFNQISPEAFVISTVENRSKIIKDLHAIIMHSPELHQYVHFNNGAVMLNSYDSNIKRGERPIKLVDDVGTIKVVPNNDKKIDGAALVLAFIDEIHLLKDELVYQNAQKSADKRRNSLVMLMSTAGYLTTGFCVDLVDRAKKIAMGKIKNDHFLPFLFCLDEDDDKSDIENKEIWHKCNPSLGKTKTIKNMEKYNNNAKYSPKDKADFITKDLNMFIDYNESEVLSAEDLLKAYLPVDLEKWKGKDLYLGLDLSKINDLSSLVCLFYDEIDDKWEAYPYYWVGNDSKLMARITGVNLNEWISKGYITKCSGKTIDNDLIAAKIKELGEQFNIRGIGYDLMGWNEFEKTLEDIDCGVRHKVLQWALHMSEPLSKIMMSILSDKLKFSDNPVMKWNWKNARIRQDRNGNYKIWKNESKDPVDGAVALNDAMALYYHLNFNPNLFVY